MPYPTSNATAPHPPPPPINTTAATPSIKPPARPRSPHFPPHNAPRVWLLAHGPSPVAIALARKLIEHGDYVVAGVVPAEFERGGERIDEFRAFLDEARGVERWRERMRVVGLDPRVVGMAQSAVAEALEAYGRVDVVLVGTGEALVGTVEELSQNSQTQALVREQFEVNFFANVNIIKAVLPSMRVRKNGHIILLSGITGHLGTPGLGMYCSSQWAIEGYCDSLAYEIAPFNVKMTIVQPNVEVNVLNNRIISPPPLLEYSYEVNGAPLARDIFISLLDKLDGRGGPDDVPNDIDDDEDEDSDEDMPPALDPTCTTIDPSTNGSFHAYSSASTSATTATATSCTDSSYSPLPTSQGDLLARAQVTSLYPSLAPEIRTALVSETAFALAAVGGHDNPPARHIVGFEAIASVKEKLKTVSEELEDFVEVSAAVDIEGEGGEDGG